MLREILEGLGNNYFENLFGDSKKVTKECYELAEAIADFLPNYHLSGHRTASKMDGSYWIEEWQAGSQTVGTIALTKFCIPSGVGSETNRIVDKFTSEVYDLTDGNAQYDRIGWRRGYLPSFVLIPEEGVSKNKVKKITRTKLIKIVKKYYPLITSSIIKASENK